MKIIGLNATKKFEASQEKNNEIDLSTECDHAEYGKILNKFFITLISFQRSLFAHASLMKSFSLGAQKNGIKCWWKVEIIVKALFIEIKVYESRKESLEIEKNFAFIL